jgi:hypothetical protein
MKRENLITYALIFFVLVVISKIYFDSDHFQLKCVVSTVDGNSYCVRERNKIDLVVDLLANVTHKMTKLVDYMDETYPDRKEVQRLKKRFNPTKIKETLPTSKYTAYSENKGEKLAFCVTTKKNNNELIDENTLTFVAIHELGHIASKSIGHNDEFWGNFKFLLENAVKINIYTPIDYKKKNKNYCGMKITDNPYYDV